MPKDKDNKVIFKSKEKLYKIIITVNGKPDLLAIELYLDIQSQLQKNKKSTLKIGYSYFTQKHKYSQETIRKKFVSLESLGLLKRTFTNEVLPSGYVLSNILNLSLVGDVL